MEFEIAAFDDWNNLVNLLTKLIENLINLKFP